MYNKGRHSIAVNCQQSRMYKSNFKSLQIIHWSIRFQRFIKFTISDHIISKKMRFIIISAILLVAVICVSSSPVEESLKKVLVKVGVPEEGSNGKSLSDPVAVENVAAGWTCTLNECVQLCYRFLNPPFWAWCSNNICWCQKAWDEMD